MTALELMHLQARTLFQLTERGHILAVNEPDPPPAPRLFVGRTVAGNFWRFRHDLPETITGEIETLLRVEPVVADLAQPPHCLQAIQTALARHAPVTAMECGPAWRFPDDLPAPIHEILPITLANDAVVREIFPILADDLPWRQPCLAIVRAGRLAAICYSARNSAAAAEAGVDTVPEFRGRGHAGSVTAAWARAVQHDGRVPLYSTTWDNLPSRAVARKLGLVPYGADLTID